MPTRKPRKYLVCPYCGKKGMYKKDHTMLCRYCDLYVILAPGQDW